MTLINTLHLISTWLIVIGQIKHLTSTWLILIGQENISPLFAQKPLLSIYLLLLYKFKTYLNKTFYIFILFFISPRFPHLAKSFSFSKQTLGILFHLKQLPLRWFGIVQVIAENQVGDSALPERVEIPIDRSKWVFLLTKTPNILSIFVLIDHVTLCYKNHIFIHPKHPPQKSDFSEQTTAYFRTSVDRPYGGSRPICTNVHKFELAVDRFTNQSTGLGDLELTHLVRSTGQIWSSRTLASRPDVDRYSTAFETPVDRQSTVGRPIGQLWARFLISFLFGFWS